MNSLEFRDPDRAKKFSDLIKKTAPEEKLTIMHVCGTHESSICEYGIRSVLPDNIELVEGPGCPVCVTPALHVDEALELSYRDDLTVATFGDMVKVPGTEDRLTKERENVKIVYSVADAVDFAKKSESEVVFFGVGFETTAATYAPVLLEGPENFSFLGSVKKIPPAMEFLLDSEEVKVDAFLAPGHVSTIIGSKPYQSLSDEYNVPIVVAGFEPLDVLSAIARLLKLLKSGEGRVENDYARAVKDEGNLKALKMIDQAFEVDDTAWRGIGEIPSSGLRVKDENLDARKKYDLKVEGDKYGVPAGCICDEIILGKSKPDKCKLFREEKCTPQNPVGPCMVGSEGMCNVWFEYGGRPKIG
ncbi:hypothetical protein AKJ51_03610 [candidate division MSBL1 archaeon SCGC-AAA382A20]|uniref:Hydrogenase assembly protein HupF n=1 Tax=candidate division MSBL1 archaeon SCGC-AAA382A20 TaxID=1698280 RepID=A0A133VJC1_9EURY|nr:hypothetical protein AKJ51_03610 [candidate division MSBL1 archaeon SCGC-AAA382A20]